MNIKGYNNEIYKDITMSMNLKGYIETYKDLTMNIKGYNNEKL